MQNIGTTLTPGQAWPFQVRGTVLQILSSGLSAGLTVQFLLGTQVQYTVEGVLTGWKIQPAGGFDSITVQSATGDTIEAIVTAGDVDIQVLETSVEIVNGAGNPVPVVVQGGPINMTATNVGINNTAANPVPVSLVSEPGAPLAVDGTVTIGNTAGSPVPVSLVSEPGAPVLVEQVPAGTLVTDVVQQAVAVAGAQILAAAAGRKRVIFYNAGTGRVGLTAAPGTTFANAAIVLQPGDAWKETDAPQLAWCAVSDTGSQLNIQTVQ